MNHTQNLHLPQWEADDRIMRTDFNDAMASIDAGVANAAVKFETGIYTGGGNYGSEQQSSLTFRFNPKVVFIFCAQSGYTAFGVIFGGQTSGMCTHPASGYGTTDTQSPWIVTWGDNSVRWYSTGGAGGSHSNKTQCDANGMTYYYLAIG